MISGEAVFLMYHELSRPGHPTCSSEPGYLRYVVDCNSFDQQLARLTTRAIPVLGVSQWIDGAATGAVVMTFDDGYESDVAVAAPALEAHGFGATFYVTTQFIGRKGNLSTGMVRELSDRGFEIGSHSVSHAFLSDLDSIALEQELTESKDRLEQIIGSSVRSISCPGGRFDSRVLAAARAAGYESVATSRISVNSRRRSHQPLGRVAITENMGIAEFDDLLDARGLRVRRARQAVLGAVKAMLGNRSYESLRARVLGSG